MNNENMDGYNNLNNMGKSNNINNPTNVTMPNYGTQNNMQNGQNYYANQNMNGYNLNQNTNNMSRKWNKEAIASIVCSAVSLLIFWWLAIAGIGSGIRAIMEIRKKNEKGMVLAILGIVIGIASVTLYYYFKFMQ